MGAIATTGLIATISQAYLAEIREQYMKRGSAVLRLALLFFGAAGVWCDGVASANLVFLETMATNAVNPWTGAGCDNVWSVTGDSFAQATNWNHGVGSPCGLQFKKGTADLTSNMITIVQGIAATGSSGYAEFYLSANGLTTNTGWTFQINAGAGFVTRLSELAGTNHNWQLYHYDLQSGELVGSLYLRFQFAGGVSSNRINLDQISLDVVTGTNSPSTNSFTGSLVLGRPTANSVTVNALADRDWVAYFEYGTQSGVYSGQSAVTNLPAGQPTETVIGSLQAGTRYYYRLRFKGVDDPTYLADMEHTFMTQRPAGSTFTFCIQGDSHPERLGKMFDPNLYTRTLLTAASDQPDFYMAIGDDFSVDQLDPASITSGEVTGRYALQRPWLGLVGNSAPLFLVNGNHEQASLANLDGTSNNVAVWAQNARNLYYSEPAPDGFYTGNTNVVQYIGLLRNYFAWTWGDALFITLDPYWSSPVCVDNSFGIQVHTTTNKWDITHGDPQYQWLKTTLEKSTARYKFVFAHHVLGTGRGGVEEAGGYEWGGRNADGTWGFTSNRPGWTSPLHQLMASNNVTIFFQGHDHIFVHQQLDGVTYQTLPNPADPNYSLFNSDAYTNNIYKTNNTGYVRVTVSPGDVKVDYVRTFLPADEGPGRTNGMVDYSYTLPSSSATNPVVYDVMLGRPTDTSIAVSVLASNNLQVYFQYGTQSGAFSNETQTASVTNGTPSAVTISGLQANQRYFYRMRYSTTGGAPFSAGAERTFVTQRARGSTFTFDIEADPHYMDTPGTVPAVWQQTLANIVADQPDFLIDLGDTFMGEKYASTNSYTMTQPGIMEACAAVRSQFFNIVGHSVPLFLVDGNHDPELGWWLDNNMPQANPPVWGARARETYYPCPVPGGFYSGATNDDYYQHVPRDGFYAFEWGDALFVMLDPFWYSNQGVAKTKDPWAWTLGTNQYYWLKSTLENSTSKFKFVFSHHLVGGSFDGEARGGLEFSPYFEWGGLNTNGTPGFAANRPGWPMPIRDLFLANNVQVFFHGHDHLYVKQDYYAGGVTNGRPDMIYQEVPQPSHFPYGLTNYATGTNFGYNYQSGVFYGSSGHLRVTVSSANVIVEYVRSCRSSDLDPGITNRMVTAAYNIAASVDTVGDGIPDWWRARYFGGSGTMTDDQSCATCDPDGDGMGNMQEYLAGTDPTNRASYLGIVAISNTSPSGMPGLVVSWTSVPGKWYCLDRATDLFVNPSFNFNIRSNILAAPPINTETDTTATGQGPYFYRIDMQ